MTKYKIRLVLEFNTRPSKRDVEDKLFNLLRDGFSLKHMEEYEREKEIVAKRQLALQKI